MGAALASGDVGRMLGALRILPEKTGGEAEAAPVAAGVSQGGQGAAPVRYHNQNAEYLGPLTFWIRNQKPGPPPSPGVREATTYT